MNRFLSAVAVVCFVVGCGGDDPSTGGDRDGDGITDVLDSCPDQPETVNNFQDLDGCPDTFNPPPPSVNPAFTGTWRGTTTYSSPGQQSVVYNSQLPLSASGTTLTVSAFCPDGSGVLQMTGRDNSASWSGTLTCAYASAACATTTLTFSSASASLTGATVTLTGNGVLAGCGQSFNITATFSGAK